MGRTVARRWREEQREQVMRLHAMRAKSRARAPGAMGYAEAVTATRDYEDSAWRDVHARLIAAGFKARLLARPWGSFLSDAYGVEITVLSIDEPPSLRSRSFVFYGLKTGRDTRHEVDYLQLARLNPRWNDARGIVSETIETWRNVAAAVRSE